MKLVMTALVAGMLATTGGAFAQSIQIGPGGVSVDPRSPRERAIDRAERRQEWRERQERRERRAWREERRGRDCRTVTTREETRRGVVSRTTRVCD